LNQKQAVAQVTVDRLHKRNEIIARIEKLKLRIPIAKYSAAQAEHRRLKEVRNAAKAEADRLQERDKPLKDQANAYEARKLGRLRLYEKATESLAETIKKAKACEEKSVQFEEEASARETEVRRINKLVGKRKAKLEEMKSDIRKLEHTEKQARQKLERLGPDDSAEIEVWVFFTRELIVGGACKEYRGGEETSTFAHSRRI
jgi:chromosome segregation ATPase